MSRERVWMPHTIDTLVSAGSQQAEGARRTLAYQRRVPTDSVVQKHTRISPLADLQATGTR